MKKKVIAIILVVALIGGTIYYSNKKVQLAAIKEVKVAMVTKGEVKSYLSTTAVIKSKSSKSYYGTQLKINKVNVKIGDTVKKGTVLLSYDISDLENGVKQTRIQYDNAMLQKEDMLNQKKSIDDKIDELKTQIKEAEKSKNPIGISTVPALKQQLSMLQPISNEKLKQLDYSVELANVSLNGANSKLNSVKQGIVADKDGVVTTLEAVEGAFPNPGQPLIIVQDIKDLKAVIALGKYDVSKVKIGQEAQIKSGDKIYKGTVSFINPAATKNVAMAGTDTSLSAEIDLEGFQGLKIDFDVDADILLGDSKDAIKVPAEALKTDKLGKNFIFINNNGVIKEKEVKLGLKSDTEVQISSGVNVGEKVVINPPTTLKEGSKVREAVQEEK